MKTLIEIHILGSSFSVNAYEKIGEGSNRAEYKSQKGYSYENKSFRYEFRGKYIPDNSISPSIS